MESYQERELETRKQTPENDALGGKELEQEEPQFTDEFMEDLSKRNKKFIVQDDYMRGRTQKQFFKKHL